MKHVNRVIKYLVETRELGLFIYPKELWDGDPYFKLTIEGWSDSAHATDPHTRKGVCSYVAELNGTPLVVKSKQSKLQLYQLKKVKGLQEHFAHNKCSML